MRHHPVVKKAGKHKPLCKNTNYLLSLQANTKFIKVGNVLNIILQYNKNAIVTVIMKTDNYVRTQYMCKILRQPFVHPSCQLRETTDYYYG